MQDSMVYIYVDTNMLYGNINCPAAASGNCIDIFK